MVGTEVLDVCLAADAIKEVITIGRNSTDLNHSKLREIQHHNFLDFSSQEKTLSESDLCFYCLGVYQSQVSKEKYWEITVNYLVALITTLERINKEIRFCLFSALGADTQERLPILFTKAKGRADQRLLESNIQKKYIFRPGFINPGKKSAIGGIYLWGFKPFYHLFPFTGIDVKGLAKVMVHVGLNDCEQTIFNNWDLRSISLSL